MRGRKPKPAGTSARRPRRLDGAAATKLPPCPKHVQGEARLEEPIAHATRSEGVYSHRRQTGDLIVFDTIGTMHSRPAFNVTRQRFLKQLSVHCPEALD